MLRALDLRRCYALGGKHLRMALAFLFPISAGFELIVVLLFLVAASHHKLPETIEGKNVKTPMELWMISVLLGTAGLVAAVIFNFVECLKLAIHGVQLSFPHALDQKYLVLLGWDFSFQWCGVFPRAGCLLFWPLQSPMHDGFEWLLFWI